MFYFYIDVSFISPPYLDFVFTGLHFLTRPCSSVNRWRSNGGEAKMTWTDPGEKNPKIIMCLGCMETHVHWRSNEAKMTWTDPGEKKPKIINVFWLHGKSCALTSFGEN